MMVDKTGVGPEGNEAADPDSDLRDNEELRLENDQSPSPSTPKNEEGGGMIKSPANRTKSNQRWMKLRTTVQLSGAISTIQKKPPLKREDSFLKRFSTRQVPETQETMDTGDDGDGEGGSYSQNGARSFLHRHRRRRKHSRLSRTVVNPDENFYFYWLFLLTICVLYNLWTLIVRESFPELQRMCSKFWFACDLFSDFIYLFDIVVQFRTGYLEQGLMVYDYKKLARHYVCCKAFFFDCTALTPLDLLQYQMGTHPILRFPRFLKVYRVYDYYYMVESRTVYPNLWRVINLIHILLILAHWFGCFYYLLSEAESFQGDWVYPYRPGEYATLTRKYLGSLYWSTLTLTTIGDLPTPETNAEYVFTIVSYLIGVFIFATIVGQVGNVITNRNANRLEFERLLDGAKTYMRHHKVPGGMKRRVLRWYDYSWSRGRIQGGGDINTALGLLPDKLKTELALHVNLSVLKKVTIFQECQPEFLHDLVLKMKAFIFTPGDLICRKGEVAREMFIIADGILEVMSETGRVLTTMKAGDFFGEIGILNLDGLNKRTADVRSVGYSELFSLSREDVLAAMKDYPEAEEILQSLGRKRLMEARNVNRNLRNLDNRNDKSFGRSFSPDIHNSRTSKRIVQRLRSDVRGLKNVLRKSRRGGRSKDESLELQPLTSLPQDQIGSISGKGILNRMPHVWSDETSQEDEPTATTSNNVHEVIGAGLPLLQRLKLLREKEAAAAAAAVNSNSATPMPSSSSSTPLTEDKKDVDAGHSQLPLLQRLAQLKTKDTQAQPSEPTTHPISTTVRTQQKPSSMSKMTMTSKDNSSEKSNISVIDKPTKGNITWSGAVTKGNDSEESNHNQKTDPLPLPEVKPKSDDSNTTAAATSKPPAFGKKMSSWKALQKAAGVPDPVKTPQPVAKPAVPEPPDNKQTPCQSVSSISHDGNSTTSDKIVERCHETMEDGDKISITNEKLSITMQSSEKRERVPKKDEEESQFAQVNSKAQNLSVQCDDNVDSSSYNRNLSKKDAHDTTDSTNNTSLSSIPNTRLVDRQEKSRVQHTKSCDFPETSSRSSGSLVAKQMKSGVKMQIISKPRIGPQPRSKSLDSGGVVDPSVEEESDSQCKVLDSSRKQSFGARTDLKNQYGLSYWDTSQESPGISQLFNETDLSSPESNETVERQNLKSILKKLSSSSLLQANSDEETTATATATTGGQNGYEMKKLMRAQTVEGYAARHSKLSKSVTFNRDTLQSPPYDAPPNSQFHFPSAKTPSTLRISSQEQKTDSCDSLGKTELLNNSTNKLELVEPDSDKPRVPAIDGLQLENNITSDQLENQKNDQNEHISKKLIHRNIIDKPLSKDKNFFRSSPLLLKRVSKEEECFGEVLSGIKHVIQGHLEEFQTKFLNKFHDLELEVKKRDDIISRLQSRIQELENDPQENGDSSDTSDQPFLRGDSVDTIVRSTSMVGRRKSWEDHSEEESFEVENMSHSASPLPTWECTKLDIESESSVSCSSSESDYRTSPYNRNWEVEMLAKELDQREDEHFCRVSLIRKRHSFSGHRTRHSIGDEMRYRKRPLHATKSLDEWNDVSGRFSSIYRSMSIGNLHSTLMRGLGNLIWGNENVASQNAIPTISQTCPPPPPDI